MNSKLRDYNMLLQRLRCLENKGRGDSEEADVVREMMDDCWRGLSEEDCRTARGLEQKLGLTEDL